MSYSVNANAVTSVTCSFTNADANVAMVVYEISGAATSSPVDGSILANNSAATTTTLTSSTFSTTNANDILIFMTAPNGAGGAATAGAGYTIPANGVSTNGRVNSEYQIMSSTQTNQTASIRWTNSTNGPAGLLAAFKAASGVAGPTITATAGTPQSAVISMAFGTQLQATLKDASNNPMGGVTVTFTAPASGPSGTFANGVNTAITNAQGVATAGVFTANSTAGGPYTVTATAAGVNTPASFSLTNLVGPAASITATAGTPQSATINSPFAVQLQATVMDASNNPVSGVTVTFTAPASGASGTFALGVNTATTNAQGIATAAAFTANGTAGSYTVTASVSGVSTQATFSLTNVAGLYGLSVSISSDRGQASALPGASVSGYVYVFTSPASQPANSAPTGITSVSFWLDNTAMTGSPMHTQTTSPYDFLGGTSVPAAGLATPWDTTTVADGTHTITQSVTESNGSVEVDTATFTVQNNLTATFTSGKFEYVFPDKNIYIYDLSNFQLVKHVSMPQLNAIRGVAVVPSTHMLYISFGGAGSAQGGNGSLLKYDLLTDTVVWTQNYSFGVDTFSITPDGNTIYMPDGAGSGDGVWEIINASTGAVTGSINTGMVGPHNTIVSLDGSTVFMGPISSNELVEGATSTNTVIRNIGPLNQGVRPFTINGHHTLAFTTANTNNGFLGFQVSDTTTGNVLYTVTPPGFGVPSGFTLNSPDHGISLSPDEKEIYLIDVANGYAHVFDVSGLPSKAPVDVADIKLTTNFSGFESPCDPIFNCVREGWIRHTLDGHYVMVSDSPDVIDTTTRTVVATLPQLINTRKGNLEIDWQNGLPVATTTHYGIGYVTTSGPPASIMATGGTPQSATIDTAFVVQLQATVKDSFGNPVSGVTVTFTAPASGPSGTFANGANTAVTNAQGIATAAVFTANGTTGSYSMTASVSGVTAQASFSLTNVLPSAISIVQSAQNFSATANTSITVPISTTAGNLLVILCENGGNNTATVTITDNVGQTWTQTTSGYASSATSNRAAMFYKPNSAAVTSVTATWTASANNIGVIVYEIHGADPNSPADGSVNSSISGSNITSLTSGSLTTAGANDLLIYGARTQTNETTWTAGAGYTIPGNGSNTRQGMQFETVTSPQSGVSTSVSWNVGAAGASGIFAAFKAASGGAGPTITATAGTPQSAVINMAFGTQLQATLKDASNNPMSGVTVTFTAPASGPSGTFANGVNTATTNAQGVATAGVFTANSTAGGPYTVTATAAGVNTPASFALTNLVGPPASIAATAGTPQSAVIDRAFAVQLQATVMDASNNPVSGVTVTFAAPPSGASGTFALGVNTATTNAQGIATAAVFTANATTGSYTVTASVSGVSTQASFSLTNLTPPPTSLVQSAQSFSASANTSITVPISTTAGNLLVIYCENGGNSSATVTITDNAGQTWTQTASGYASSAATNRAAMFYKPNSAAITSVTATWTASANNIGAIVYEINGADPSSPADGSVNSSISGTGITSLTSGSLTTTTANDILIYGARAQSDQTAWTPGAGYTIPANGSNTRQGMQYELVSAVQTGVTTSMSWGAGAIGASGIFAAFKPVNPVAISPQHTAITTSQTQQFTVTVSNSLQGSPVTWVVDGVAGGNASVGTITTAGLYTPPGTVSNHTVAAQVQAYSASAPVFVTNYPGTYMRDVDTFRTGQNLNESVLTTANVNSTEFGKLFSYSIDGYADASPLYVANVNIPGQGLYDVVYVATEHDSVYAFDADGFTGSPLWHVSFINPAAGITTVSPTDTGDTVPNMVEVGITGTPVIDPTTGTMYLVAKTRETSGSTTNFVQRLHALDITTGAEKFGGPVVIQASVPGTGDGASGGQVPWTALHQNQRAALLLSNGIVYIAWAAHADHAPYHGWIMGYNATTLQQVMVYNTTPNGSGGGIWQSGDGLTTDSTGRIYAVTGNGTFDNNIGGIDFGDTVLAINPDGTRSDFFTPHDQSTMASSDLDLGSGGVLLLPDQSGAHPHEAITAGKTGTIYVVDRDKMGGFNPNNDSQIVQTLVNTFPGNTFQTGNFKAPVYFNGHVYFSADADTIKAFSVTNGLLSTSPTSQASFVSTYPGCTLQISANGSSNGILWVIQSFFAANQNDVSTTPGILHAYDAGDLTHELYNSNQAQTPSGRDQLDFTVKWAAPLVANGKVIVATQGHLTIFGLLH